MTDLVLCVIHAVHVLCVIHAVHVLCVIHAVNVLCVIHAVNVLCIIRAVYTSIQYNYLTCTSHNRLCSIDGILCMI